MTADSAESVLIDLSVEAGDWPPETELLSLVEKAIAAAEAALSPPQGGRELRELSILFTDDAAIRVLNRDWRGKDKPTNVLSFPQPSGPLLGDIVLGFGTVRREAELASKPLMDHIAHLVVHGFLHLVGFDHETDADAEDMEGLERAALERLGIADPYAAPQDQ